MVLYPALLPCASRIEGHGALVATAIVRTPMQAGNCRQRRTHAQLPQRLALAFVIDQALYAAWIAWVNTYAYTDFVLMRLPGVLAARAGTDTAPTPVRFISDLQAELVPLHRLWIWRVRVDAEWLPEAA